MQPIFIILNYALVFPFGETAVIKICIIILVYVSGIPFFMAERGIRRQVIIKTAHMRMNRGIWVLLFSRFGRQGAPGKDFLQYSVKKPGGVALSKKRYQNPS